jgi:hypothetical protein
MPDPASIQVWRRADAGFAAELAAARRKGDWARRYAFDEAVAGAFLARVAAGARIRDLLAKPGMPSQGAFRYWSRTQVGFQAELARLRAVSYARRKRPRPYRHFDPATADRMLVRVAKGEPWRRMLETDPTMPCRVVVYRWRAEEREWDAALKIAFKVGRLARERARSRARCSRQITDEVTDRIVVGGSLRSLARDADMPSAGTLYKWVARFPDFAAEVARACEIREWGLNDRMLDICHRNGPFGLAATKREAAPLQLRVNQLAKRPGWKRAREGSG